MRSAIDRIFDLIEAIASRPDGVALNELAQMSNLSKPTAHRLLSDMIDRGLVRQAGPNGVYSLTLEIALLGFRHLANVGFLDICQPELDKLAADAGELVRLSWLDGDRLVIVAESQGAKPGLRFDANLGRPVVLHTMAVGKIFLTRMPREQAMRLVREQGLLGKPASGPNAIQTESELELDLSRSEKQGFALAYDEGDLGTAAIAVPIVEQATGRFLGAVAIVAPTARWTKARLSEFAPALHATAAAIVGKAAIAPYCRRTEGSVGRTSRL
ncbi:IclR family transcriptional regulator [Bosea caraganae]|uniref:IclR family transcriptional regulator n=1 Tax=Bosea caraganae TaxID=2763117 RepID=A0A370LA09_9HYPH|nr:IclR family transcriptional regulator [Bosea caraganae]RDJ26812.1 IclR family transcriptional regulator [Bosea caraganae]RDJ30698.1 IclR family transcriptional regulator [Bosea caraganae]